MAKEEYYYTHEHQPSWPETAEIDGKKSHVDLLEAKKKVLLRGGFAGYWSASGFELNDAW